MLMKNIKDVHNFIIIFIISVRISKKHVKLTYIPLDFKKLAPESICNTNGIQYPPPILKKGK